MKVGFQLVFSRGGLAEAQYGRRADQTDENPKLVDFDTSNIPSCEACTKDGIECVRATNIRFRSSNKSASGPFSFPADQTWIHTDRQLTYLDETPRVIRWYEDPDCFETDHDDSWFDSRDQTGFEDSICTRGHLSQGSQNVDMTVEGSPSFPEPLEEAANSRARPLVPLQAVTPVHEAVLMRNFTENMALWADITDRGRTFETEVPRRALYHATLRYAIFAFSSRHINRHRRGQESTEALEYYDKCLNLLIPAISNPEHHVTEEVFAAVAILRQYEEMDSEDRGLHLTGTTRIVNSMRDWGFTPGLREASAWLCLRQDIYISMVQQSPLKTDLDTFLQSDIYGRDDDTAYAARIVVIVARILIGTSAEEVESRMCVLDEARAELEEWYDSRPSTFTPIWIGSGSSEAGRLPEIWMLLPCHGGGVLVEKSDQEAVKAFLQHMQQTTSWNTEPMVTSLQEQWDEF
ncbi:hypothetical protein Daus18300_002163 [Diaporthe australafricana]|uniref:Uncharacterized protein n=1 Tax=Diaporthe australafricana TaxID=127596 RepID=A0ABR3XR76_9PEZI